MDYETILQTVGEEPEYLYKTARGSAYGHYEDNSSIRNRSGEGHKDPTVGLQTRSGKTVYMAPEDVQKVAGLFQNPELGTQFKPTVYDKETKSGKVALSFLEDYGPKKAGSVIHEAPFTTTPKKGLHPVEINRSESPVGSAGRGIHWGSAITEVIPRGSFPSRAPTQSGGGFRPGQDNLQHSINPLKLAGGGGVELPTNYRTGGRVRMI